MGREQDESLKDSAHGFCVGAQPQRSLGVWSSLGSESWVLCLVLISLLCDQFFYLAQVPNPASLFSKRANLLKWCIDCLVSASWNVTSFFPQVGPLIKQPALSCSIKQHARHALSIGVPVQGPRQALLFKSMVWIFWIHLLPAVWSWAGYLSVWGFTSSSVKWS